MIYIRHEHVYFHALRHGRSVGRPARARLTTQAPAEVARHTPHVGYVLYLDRHRHVRTRRTGPDWPASQVGCGRVSFERYTT